MTDPLQFSLANKRNWTATVRFPSWKGFQARNGPYGAQDSDTLSDGVVPVVFAPEGRGTEPLTDTEIDAVRWVVEHEASISQALISSLSKEYPTLQKEYGYSGKERAELMPDIKSPDDLRRLIGLSSVNVHQVQKNGVPYAGFEFGCTWDDEHGLGILMHGTRTVEIGGADTAILKWIAEEDTRRPLTRTDRIQ